MVAPVFHPIELTHQVGKIQGATQRIAPAMIVRL
jgi:hypothetical protein